MRLIPCTEEAHAGTILAILNDAIVTSTALYDYKPRTPEQMAGWFATKRANGFPVIGAVDDDGRLMGFASYGTFRAFPAYKYTVEHSVYVDAADRGKGLGRTLAYSGETADMIGVMANILTIAILAALIDQVILENLKHRLLKYQYV